MLPSKPPPPSWIDIPFQEVGTSTWKRISRACGSIGSMAPVIAQYSGRAGCEPPGSDAAFNLAEMIFAPLVGNPMALAGTLRPFIASQATVGWIGPDFSSGRGWAFPTPASEATPKKIPSAKRIVTLRRFM
jgi:hypothetical protein